MDLSIIILCWNSKQYLDPCLQSISGATKLISKEVIIIDNGSRDDSVMHIKKNYPQVKLIENKVNKGVGPARNQGLEIAKGRYLLILDVDTIIHENAIRTLIQTFECDERIGLCGPKLIGEDGKLQYSCREFPSVFSKLYRQLPQKWQNFFLGNEEMRDWKHDSLREVGYVIGACQLIRKEAQEDVGLLDSRMFYGVEEIDFCLRLWKKGWKVVYNPESTVTHVEQRACRKKLFSRLTAEHIKSLALFFLKYKYIRPPAFPRLQN